MLDGGLAFGALAGTIPTMVTAMTTQTIDEAHRTVYAMCAVAMSLSIGPYFALTRQVFLAREALVEMDVPTRQSYVMAIVKPTERTRASGVTNVTRNVAWAVGPSIAGVVMQHVALAGPIVIGGVLKIVYDLILYRAFRHVRPPEEATPTPVRIGASV